jgi:predicted MPP superfamily phosphohydrolase
MLIAIIIPGLILIMIVWILVERKQLVMTSYNAVSDKLPKAFHNTSFVVLADLHNSKFGKNNERLIRMIERCSPEFIIVAGDMISKRAKCYPGDTFSLLAQLAKKYKIYYAYGNHELRMEKQYPEYGGWNEDRVGSTWVEYKKRLK